MRTSWLALALGLAVLGCTEEPGAKLRRECISLVDEVMKEEQTVPTNELAPELKKRGIEVPLLMHRSAFDHEFVRSGSNTTMRPIPPALAEQRYTSARREYEAKWAIIEKTPAYQEAWNAVRAAVRTEKVKGCIVERADRLGVR